MVYTRLMAANTRSMAKTQSTVKTKSPKRKRAMSIPESVPESEPESEPESVAGAQDLLKGAHVAEQRQETGKSESIGPFSIGPSKRSELYAELLESLPLEGRNLPGEDDGVLVESDEEGEGESEEEDVHDEAGAENASTPPSPQAQKSLLEILSSLTYTVSHTPSWITGLLVPDPHPDLTPEQMRLVTEILYYDEVERLTKIKRSLDKELLSEIAYADDTQDTGPPRKRLKTGENTSRSSSVDNTLDMSLSGAKWTFTHFNETLEIQVSDESDETVYARGIWRLHFADGVLVKEKLDAWPRDIWGQGIGWVEDEEDREIEEEKESETEGESEGESEETRHEEEDEEEEDED